MSGPQTLGLTVDSTSCGVTTRNSRMLSFLEKLNYPAIAMSRKDATTEVSVGEAVGQATKYVS